MSFWDFIPQPDKPEEKENEDDTKVTIPPINPLLWQGDFYAKIVLICKEMIIGLTSVFYI